MTASYNWQINFLPESPEQLVSLELTGRNVAQLIQFDRYDNAYRTIEERTAWAAHVSAWLNRNWAWLIEHHIVALARPTDPDAIMIGRPAITWWCHERAQMLRAQWL